MKTETLKIALSKMLEQDVTYADYQLETLQGGTVGNVQLISGIAKTTKGETPYKIILKTQAKWERQGDPNSWRREYDLYASELGKSFSHTFSWPTCYLAEFSGNETRLWIKYIEGATGDALTTEMLENTATKLGQYQGRLLAKNHDYLQNITNLGRLNAIEEHYRHWKLKNVEYKYVRDPHCKIPKHLCDMIIDIDNRADAIFENIRKLPVVLCHRDFWIANIISTDDGITLIDWDTAGWGYLGEDIIQLITDETNPVYWDEYKHRLIPEYFKGFSEYVRMPDTAQKIICQIPLVHLGYLSVLYFLQNDLVAGEHYPGIESLQKLYDVFYDKKDGI